jgi:hypothetical protein
MLESFALNKHHIHNSDFKHMHLILERKAFSILKQKPMLMKQFPEASHLNNDE